MKRFLAWLRREWAMLRTYRRRHVFVNVEGCTVVGQLQLSQVAVVLTDPLIAALRAHAGSNPRDIIDVSLCLRSCIFRNGEVQWPSGAEPTVIKLAPLASGFWCPRSNDHVCRRSDCIGSVCKLGHDVELGDTSE